MPGDHRAAKLRSYNPYTPPRPVVGARLRRAIIAQPSCAPTTHTPPRPVAGARLRRAIIGKPSA